MHHHAALLPASLVSSVPALGVISYIHEQVRSLPLLSTVLLETLPQQAPECRVAGEIDSADSQWGGKGPEPVGSVIGISPRPPPSITVVCGLPLDHKNWLFSGYLSLMI